MNSPHQFPTYDSLWEYNRREGNCAVCGKPSRGNQMFCDEHAHLGGEMGPNEDNDDWFKRVIEQWPRDGEDPWQEAAPKPVDWKEQQMQMDVPNTQNQGLEVLHGNTEPWANMNGRRPFIYVPEHNRIYLGKEDTYHQNLLDDFDDEIGDGFKDLGSGDDWGSGGAQRYHGYAGGTDPYWSKKPLSWYGAGPTDDHIGRIKEALAPHIPSVLDDEEDDTDDWGDMEEHYGKIAQNPDQMALFPSQPVPKLQVIEGTYDSEGSDYEDFEGRRPVLWDRENETVYLGQPDTYHSDLYEEFGLGYGQAEKGYVGGGRSWGGGALKWYFGKPQEHDDVAAALERHAPGVTQQKAPAHDEDGGWDDFHEGSATPFKGHIEAKPEARESAAWDDSGDGDAAYEKWLKDRSEMSMADAAEEDQKFIEKAPVACPDCGSMWIERKKDGTFECQGCYKILDNGADQRPMLFKKSPSFKENPLQWSPGAWGKGFYVNGRPYTWETDFEGTDPYHTDVADDNDLDPRGIWNPFWIDPHGYAYPSPSWGPEVWNDDLIEHIMAAEPRIKKFIKPQRKPAVRPGDDRAEMPRWVKDFGIKAKTAASQEMIHWWKTRKPIRSNDAKIIGEYAAALDLSKKAFEDFLDEHKDDVQGDFEKFKKKAVKRFQATSRNAKVNGFFAKLFS